MDEREHQLRGELLIVDEHIASLNNMARVISAALEKATQTRIETARQLGEIVIARMEEQITEG